jgi:hypothetical protein
MKEKIDHLTHFDVVVKAELGACLSAEDMLVTLARNYDLRQPLGPMTKAAFTLGLRQAVAMLKPEVTGTAAFAQKEIKDTRYPHLKVIK